MMQTAMLAACLSVAVAQRSDAPVAGTPPLAPAPEVRAVAFLSREVPRWSRENHCYSCHNNADAAKALYQAAHAGWQVPDQALADTTRWLEQPGRWDHNGGDTPNNDRRLARVAFSGAVATAFETGSIKDRAVLLDVALRLLADQAADGSWAPDGDETDPSPATYGRPLATLIARRTLALADPRRFRAAIARADAWLLGLEIHSVTDAAVTLMVLAQAEPKVADRPARRKPSLDLLRRAQTDDGGWGPRPRTPPEPFDTALVLLSLAECGDSAEVRDLIARGRAFLIAQQCADGSWPETTRPRGNVSYAQRISTTGWATRALLATHGRRAHSAAGKSE